MKVRSITGLVGDNGNTHALSSESLSLMLEGACNQRPSVGFQYPGKPSSLLGLCVGKRRLLEVEEAGAKGLPKRRRLESALSVGGEDRSRSRLAQEGTRFSETLGFGRQPVTSWQFAKKRALMSPQVEHSPSKRRAFGVVTTDEATSGQVADVPRFDDRGLQGRRGRPDRARSKDKSYVLDLSLSLRRLHSEFYKAKGERKSAILRKVTSATEGFLHHSQGYKYSASDCVHLANKLGKFVQLKACRQALVWLAEKTLREGSLRPLGHQASMLANALAKNGANKTCQAAIFRIAQRVKIDSHLSLAMRVRCASHYLNALSKCRSSRQARELALDMARKITKDRALWLAMNEHAVGSVLNALSKWFDDKRARELALCLADRLVKEECLRRSLNSLGLSTIMNALSKWPNEERAGEALLHLAERIAQERNLRHGMNAQEVANVLNAVSKWFGDKRARKAGLCLADRIVQDEALRRAMSPQHVSHAMNALSKWFEDERARAGALSLADRIAQDEVLRRAMDAQAIANTMNALSKWFEDERARAPALCLADRIAQEEALRCAMNEEGVATTMNALSKWFEYKRARQAGLCLADRIAQDELLRRAMQAQAVANTMNALSKWFEDNRAQAAALCVADRIAQDEPLRRALSPQELSNTLNALSKWFEDERTRAASLALADRIARDERLRRAMDAQAVANTLSALGMWGQASAALEAAHQLALLLGGDSHPWASFNFMHLSHVVAALGWLSQDGNSISQPLDILDSLANYLKDHPAGFETATITDIGLLFKVYARLQLHKALRPLGKPALTQVQRLCERTRLHDDTLEGVGHFCVGLLPFVRNFELKNYRTAALQVFEMMHPIVASKVQGYLRQVRLTSSLTEARLLKDGKQACGTRYPALTLYQVLKAYHVVCLYYKHRPLKDVDLQRLQARQKALTQ